MMYNFIILLFLSFMKFSPDKEMKVKKNDVCGN